MGLPGAAVQANMQQYQQGSHADKLWKMPSLECGGMGLDYIHQGLQV